MNPERIHALINGPLKEMVLMDRKTVNQATRDKDLEAMQLIASLGLSVFCMCAAYLDPSKAMNYMEVQTSLSREYLGLSLAEQSAMSQAIQKLTSQHPTHSPENN